jgi:hypothetical protein
MPTREEIMAFVRQQFDRAVRTVDGAWLSLYCLLLDYVHGVPRITDSNRLRHGVWRERARQVELALASAMATDPREVPKHLDGLMQTLYPRGTQRMNPVGIAFACSIVYLINRFSSGKYDWRMETKIGTEVFPDLRGFRRRSVDIVAFQKGKPKAVISSKWGIRHDRVRDPQEEADTYKREVPSLKFYVVTNEFDAARLQKVLAYPSIDAVFHVHRDLVREAYGGRANELQNLKDITDLVALFR